jgi:hypothetical protein
MSKLIGQLKDAENRIEEERKKFSESIREEQRFIDITPKRAFEYAYERLKGCYKPVNEALELLLSFKNPKTFSGNDLFETHRKRLEFVREDITRHGHSDFDFMMMEYFSRFDLNLKALLHKEYSYFFNEAIHHRKVQFIYQEINGQTYVSVGGVRMGDSMDRREYSIRYSGIDGVPKVTCHLQVISNVTFEPVAADSSDLLLDEEGFLNCKEFKSIEVEPAPKHPYPLYM